MSTEFRKREEKWKVLATGLTTLADEDWAEDVSDALPATTRRGKVPFQRNDGTGKTVGVDFIVWAYVNATRVLVDYAGETFVAEAYFFQKPPVVKAPATGLSSQILGRTVAEASAQADGRSELAFHTAERTGCEFANVYRFDCCGADSFTLRLHTLSGAPSGADRYEIWYREVCV